MAISLTTPVAGSSAWASQVASFAISSAVGALDMPPLSLADIRQPRGVDDVGPNDRRLCLWTSALHRDRSRRRSLSLPLPDVPTRHRLGLDRLQKRQAGRSGLEH